MYPYFRLIRILLKAKYGAKLQLYDKSIVTMRVFVCDIDIYPELNNGRHLTIMDMGRMDLAQRTGLLRTVHKKKWGLAISGASVRFRHRLKAFVRFQLHSQIVATDDRWFYFHQYTMCKGKIHSAALIRGAITSKQGLVPVKQVMDALGMSDWKPSMPEWVEAWSKAEELRPWNEVS
jgi:acyl-CoA thioesterase FadM